MHRDHVGWFSPSLGRGMELLWFGHWGRPVLAFPTSAARFYELEDFGLVGALTDKIEGGEIQLCCVDSVNDESWYNRGAHPADRVRRHDAYDRYLRHEVIPYAAARARRDDLVTYGASFGAYQAVNLACRYPEHVRKVVAFSGMYDVHQFLDGYWDDLCYFHCPTAYLPNLDGDWVRRLAGVQFVIATGEHDHLVGATRDMLHLLGRKGIPAYGEVWQGQFGHDWPYWKEHLRRFVP
ncbi:MAG: esterase family protein [Gemmatimonadota bacterium]